MWPGLAKLIVCLGVSLLSGCGGGGGDSSPSTPPPVGDLGFVTSNLPDNSVDVSASATWRFFFDANVAPDAALSTSVQLSSMEGVVPVIADVDAGHLRVATSQRLKMRTDYTLTIKAGIKGSNGTVLRSDVVRRFRTLLLDGDSRVIEPGNIALSNYSGERTFRIGDVNGDNLPDIVQIGGDAELLYQGNSFAINVFSQRADHSFSRTQNLLIHESQHGYLNSMGEIEIVDLDHDEIPEIVIGIQRRLPGLTGLMVLKQDAQHSYAVADFIATNFAYRLFIADINGDSKRDLLSIGKGLTSTDGPATCGSVAVLSSPAGARAQSPTILPCATYEAALGPLDRPDQLNLVVLRSPFMLPGQSFQSRLSIYKLDAEGHPTLDNGLMAAAAPVCSGLLDCSGLMLMDANGDGIQDLMFTHALVAERTSETIIYTREVQSSYAEFTRQAFGSSVYAFKPSDLDRDGLDDIAVVAQGGGSYVGAGFTMRTRRLELSRLIPIVAFDTMKQSTVGVADLDVDGFPDVVLDSYNSGLSVMFQRRH